MLQKSRNESDHIELAYQRWARRFVADEWTPYLMTFMFRPIGGNVTHRTRVMEGEIERIYRMHLSRIIRNPSAPSSGGRLPVWFCAPDFPVHKHRRGTLSDVIVNQGQHWHAIAFVPPWSRLRTGLDTHFAEHRSRYVLADHPLDRLDVVPVTHRVGYVTGYSRKAVARSLVGVDSTLILPYSSYEL